VRHRSRSAKNRTFSSGADRMSTVPPEFRSARPDLDRRRGPARSSNHRNLALSARRVSSSFG
jgi:hypothetical protein